MSYNKYNTRQSTGRYNTPGRFVSAGQSWEQDMKTIERYRAQRKEHKTCTAEFSVLWRWQPSYQPLSECTELCPKTCHGRYKCTHCVFYDVNYLRTANTANCCQLSSGHQEQQMKYNAPQHEHLNVQFNNTISQPPQQSQPSYNNGDFVEVHGQEDDQVHIFRDVTCDMEASTANADDQATDNTGSEEPNSQRPHWMKPKLQGVRKISNKERRRRQNGSLRRLLTPKNALMVLNEIDKGDNTFKVEAVNLTAGQYYKPTTPGSFCAALCSGGNSYKGYGDNKMAARNAAAEQAVRDVLLKKMSALMSDEGGECEEDLPMIQLASFALYKLFSEWEAQGHRVPQLRPSQMTDTASDGGSVSGGGRAPKGRTVRTELPESAADMHPCMLLSYMRPGLSYREVAVEGTQPSNIMFTMEVDVDGEVYSGRAGNKREARKAAAREACRAIFGMRFNDEPQ